MVVENGRRLGVAVAEARLALHPVLIPLGVGSHRRPGGHAIGPPVDEDAELGVGEPGGHRPPVERLPGGLIFLRRRAARGDRRQQDREKKSVSYRHTGISRGEGLISQRRSASAIIAHPRRDSSPGGAGSGNFPWQLPPRCGTASPVSKRLEPRAKTLPAGKQWHAAPQVLTDDENEIIGKGNPVPPDEVDCEHGGFTSWPACRSRQGVRCHRAGGHGRGFRNYERNFAAGPDVRSTRDRRCPGEIGMRKTARTRCVAVFVDVAWQSLRARPPCDTRMQLRVLFPNTAGAAVRGTTLGNVYRVRWLP